MQILGVFNDIYGSTANMTIGQTLLISLIGFSIVFLILGLLALFVFFMSKIFDILNVKKDTKAKSLSASPSSAPLNTYNLPDNCSQGNLVLSGVTEEQAAVIMAITSDKSGIPLNHLKFNSIRCLEDEKK